MKRKHGFPKVLAALARGALATALKRGERDKRVGTDTPHGQQLAVRQDARKEAIALLSALADGQSVAQFAYARGWKPPAWAGDQAELNLEASRWLDERWKAAVREVDG